MGGELVWLTYMSREGMCMLVNLKYTVSIYAHTVSDRTKSLQTFQDWQHARLSRERRACFFKTCKTRIPRRQPVCRQLWGGCSTSAGCFSCTEAVEQGGVTWWLLHMGQQEHTKMLPGLLLEGFRHHFCVQTSQGLHTSMLAWEEQKKKSLSSSSFKIFPF